MIDSVKIKVIPTPWLYHAFPLFGKFLYTQIQDPNQRSLYFLRVSNISTYTARMDAFTTT